MQSLFQTDTQRKLEIKLLFLALLGQWLGPRFCDVARSQSSQAVLQQHS